MEQAVNTFQKGLQLDSHPMMQGNESLTDCLNGTFITQNGNEITLQNDMGNARVDHAYLPAGYEPVGIKEYGGVIYVVCHNPLTGKSQVGSFPSPERIKGTEYSDLGCKLNLCDIWNNNEPATDLFNIKCLTTDSIMLPLTSDTSLHVGDKFSIYCSNDSNFFKDVSNYDNVEDSLIKSPKNKLYTLSIGILNSQNEFVDITKSLKRFDENGTVLENTGNKLYDFNQGYFIRKYNQQYAPQWNESDTKTYLNNRLADPNVNTYSYKLIGPLYIKQQINTIQDFSYNIKGFWEEGLKGKNVTLTITATIKYNCPDGINGSGEGTETYKYLDLYTEGDIPNMFMFDVILSSNSDPKESESSEVKFHTYDSNTDLYTLVLERKYVFENQSDDLLEFVIGVPANVDGVCKDEKYYLKNLSEKVTININLLGSGKVQLKGYRFFNHDDYSTITYTLEYYEREDKPIRNMKFRFTNVTNNEDIIESEPLPVYNGRASVKLRYNTQQALYNGELIYEQFEDGKWKDKKIRDTNINTHLSSTDYYNYIFFLSTKLLNPCYNSVSGEFINDFRKFAYYSHNNYAKNSENIYQSNGVADLTEDEFNIIKEKLTLNYQLQSNYSASIEKVGDLERTGNLLISSFGGYSTVVDGSSESGNAGSFEGSEDGSSSGTGGGFGGRRAPMLPTYQELKESVSPSITSHETQGCFDDQLYQAEFKGLTLTDTTPNIENFGNYTIPIYSQIRLYMYLKGPTTKLTFKFNIGQSNIDTVTKVYKYVNTGYTNSEELPAPVLNAYLPFTITIPNNIFEKHQQNGTVPLSISLSWQNDEFFVYGLAVLTNVEVSNYTGQTISLPTDYNPLPYELEPLSIPSGLNTQQLLTYREGLTKRAENITSSLVNGYTTFIKDLSNPDGYSDTIVAKLDGGRYQFMGFSTFNDEERSPRLLLVKSGYIDIAEYIESCANQQCTLQYNKSQIFSLIPMASNSKISLYYMTENDSIVYNKCYKYTYYGQSENNEEQGLRLRLSDGSSYDMFNFGLNDSLQINIGETTCKFKVNINFNIIGDQNYGSFEYEMQSGEIYNVKNLMENLIPIWDTDGKFVTCRILNINHITDSNGNSYTDVSDNTIIPVTLQVYKAIPGIQYNVQNTVYGDVPPVGLITESNEESSDIVVDTLPDTNTQQSSTTTEIINIPNEIKLKYSQRYKIVDYSSPELYLADYNLYPDYLIESVQEGVTCTPEYKITESDIKYKGHGTQPSLTNSDIYTIIENYITFNQIFKSNVNKDSNKILSNCFLNIHNVLDATLTTNNYDIADYCALAISNANSGNKHWIGLVKETKQAIRNLAKMEKWYGNEHNGDGHQFKFEEYKSQFFGDLNKSNSIFSYNFFSGAIIDDHYLTGIDMSNSIHYDGTKCLINYARVWWRGINGDWALIKTPFVGSNHISPEYYGMSSRGNTGLNHPADKSLFINFLKNNLFVRDVTYCALQEQTCKAVGVCVPGKNYIYSDRFDLYGTISTKTFFSSNEDLEGQDTNQYNYPIKFITPNSISPLIEDDVIVFSLPHYEEFFDEIDNVLNSNTISSMDLETGKLYDINGNPLLPGYIYIKQNGELVMSSEYSSKLVPSSRYKFNDKYNTLLFNIVDYVKPDYTYDVGYKDSPKFTSIDYGQSAINL